MPCILPHELLPYLLEHELFPFVPERQCKRYWNHLCETSSPVALKIPSKNYIPLFIWGDSANYCKDESVIVICFGCILDDRKNSIESRFPLVICREDSCKQHRILFYQTFFKIPILLPTSQMQTFKEKSVGFRTLAAYLQPVTWLLDQCVVVASLTPARLLPWLGSWGVLSWTICTYIETPFVFFGRNTL